MLVKLLSIILLCFLYNNSFSQSTYAPTKDSPFDRITNEVSRYKFDSSDVPDDKITREIIELRKLRGGFNINEVIQYKLEEDLKKKDIDKATYLKLKEFFTNGKGKTMLDNAVIRIYRDHFTHSELKKITKFYRSSAGQKMGEIFPVIMLETLAAAERVKQYAPK